MKLTLKSAVAHPKNAKSGKLPTSMQIKSIPSLNAPKVGATGTKFKYKGAREK